MDTGEWDTGEPCYLKDFVKTSIRGFLGRNKSWGLTHNRDHSTEVRFILFIGGTKIEGNSTIHCVCPYPKVSIIYISSV